ncbi:phage tail assembly protein T, partial [Enterobacter hormaechei]
EFDRQSPVGDIRGDIQAAQIVSALYGAQGVKVPLDDAILRWGGDEQSAPKDPFAGLEAALMAASN